MALYSRVVTTGIGGTQPCVSVLHYPCQVRINVARHGSTPLYRFKSFLSLPRARTPVRSSLRVQESPPQLLPGSWNRVNNMSVLFSIHLLFHPIITAVTGVKNILCLLFPFYIGFVFISLEIISRDADIWNYRNVEYMYMWHSANKQFSQASESCHDLIFVFHLASCTARNISNGFVLGKLYEVAIQTVIMTNKIRRALRSGCRPGKRGNTDSTRTQGRQLSGICRPIDLEVKSSMLCSSIEKTSKTAPSFVPIIKTEPDFPAVPVQTFVGSSIPLGRTCTVSNSLRLRKNIRTCGIA
jgi:hypothetical protein